MGQFLITEQLLTSLVPLRGQASVVVTNGCFDILHLGHLRYLEACKQLGDQLVVLVNSDASVKRLKGPTRPIVAEGDRAALVAGLHCVDYVVLFEEDTPENLLKIIKPDFYAKGNQYNEENLPEMNTLRAIGTQVRFVPMVENRSTSSVIQTIQQQLLSEMKSATTPAEAY